jgi:hypothetical protein
MYLYIIANMKTEGIVPVAMHESETVEICKWQILSTEMVSFECVLPRLNG